MKTRKLIAAILIGMMLLHNTNAQEPNNLKSKYKCWIYYDSTSAYSNLKGIIHSVADSGIIFATSISGNTFKEDDRQLRYLEISNIEKIKIRKKGNVGRGILIGAGVGFLVGGLIGYASGDDNPGWFSMTAEAKAVALGTALSIPGMLIGGIAGATRITIPISRKQNRYKMQQAEIRSYTSTK